MAIDIKHAVELNGHDDDMISFQKHIKLLFFLCSLLYLSSCGTSHHSRGPKEYIEKNGLHSDKKPHEIAKELGESGKGKKRAYRRQLGKQWKKMHPGEPRRENPYLHKLQR